MNYVAVDIEANPPFNVGQVYRQMYDDLLIKVAESGGIADWSTLAMEFDEDTNTAQLTVMVRT